MSHAQITRTQPATNIGVAATDTTFTQFARGFIPTGDGVVRTTDSEGATVDIPVKGGAVYPIMLRDVVAAGTTAGVIILLY